MLLDQNFVNYGYKHLKENFKYHYDGEKAIDRLISDWTTIYKISPRSIESHPYVLRTERWRAQRLLRLLETMSLFDKTKRLITNEAPYSEEGYIVVVRTQGKEIIIDGRRRINAKRESPNYLFNVHIIDFLDFIPQSDRVIICGSGPSLYQYNPKDLYKTGATIIAINGAIEYIKKPDYWFTLDHSPENMNILKKRNKFTKYFMALPDRYPAVKNLHTRFQRIEKGKMFKSVAAPGGFSDNWAEIHTGNSAFGGMNLAYHMNPKKILLLGVDATQERRVDGGFSRDLSHLPLLFRSCVPQLNLKNIRVKSGGNLSVFKQVSPEEALEWISTE